MAVGGNDLFGPYTRKLQERKKGTKEENVKLISRVFEEQESRDKAAKKSRHLLQHVLLVPFLTSPLWTLSPPPGPKSPTIGLLVSPFGRNPRQSSSSMGQFPAKDKKSSSQSNFRSGSRGQGPARKDRQ